MRRIGKTSVLLVTWALAACTGSDAPDDVDPTGTDAVADTAFERPTAPWEQVVWVTLDGADAPGVLVMQGGAGEHRFTDATGRAVVPIDPTIPGDLVLLAAAEGARVRGIDLPRPMLPDATVALTSYDPADNPAYVFQDPGTPTRSGDTSTCAHCHVRQVADWVDSAHGHAASNPVVQDVYAGTGGFAEAACAPAGGTWVTGRLPGGGTGGRCRVGAGTLPDLNPGCGDGALCDAPQATGACADCHAPGIDGVLGGRDLLDATGIAHDHGVHCDVCHKVAAVDLDAPAGVGGRLVVVRPSEPSTVTTLDWDPLTFGPVADVVNPRMGSVYAPVFHEATLCAGCHELRQAALVPGTDVDRARWPDGTLPIQSTWSEWSAGPLAGVAPCQSCHMPPDAEAGNTADIDLVPSPRVGRIAGWWRPAGTSRHHSWDGPRSADGALLKLAATLEVATARDADTLSVDVTVRHTGAGHALPTGEPFRAVILAVSATCDGTPLVATGGDAIPFAGGAWARQEAGGDWSRWPGARVGQVVRVVRHDGWRDDPSPGPFGDGTFTGAAAGNRHLQVVGQATITAVDGDGRVTFDAALPEGDEAFLGDAGALVPGQAGRAVAGAPGHAFARVLADADGALQVPHHRAVDVVSDNRLVPGTAVHTTHTFAATCADPVVTAQLVWRGLPVTLVAERGWTSPDRPIAEVVR